MAGKYIEFLNPGYSTLFTRDLQYDLNTSFTTSESGNVFDPDNANPLVEGEWLSFTAAGKVQRFGAGTQQAGDNVANVPCALHFSERGRYDAQITRKAHIVTGPNGFDFKTKLCVVDASAAAGTRLFVADVEDASGNFKKGLMDATSLENSSAHSAFAVATSAGTVENANYYWSPGYIQRRIGTGEIVVHFDPQLILCIAS